MTIKYTTDFNINRVLLFTSAGSIDVSQYLVELSYYEEIFSPAISGKLMLTETFNLIGLSSLSGNEYIQIYFDKTTNEDGNKNYESVNRTFRVFSISKRHMDTGNNYETYIINFCSEELFLSERYRISKSYNKQKISDIISDIMKTFLGVGKGLGKNFYVEPTTGVYDFVLPNKKIFETINWLCNYAMSSSNATGADMLFFETNMGFQLNSLQTLFSRNPVVQFTYNPKNLADSYGEPDFSDEQYEIMKLEVLDTFDTLGATSKGTFANRVMTLNPLLRSKQVIDFDYNKYQMDSSSTQLNGGALTNNYKDRFNTYSWGMPPADRQSGAFRLTVSNSNLSNIDQIKSTPGSVTNDYMIEKTLHNRVAQLNLANYNRLRVTIPGYNELSVGMTINANIFGTTTTSTGRTQDPHLSGKYLVSALRHIITPTSYISVVEIIKDSNVSQVGGLDNNDSGWNNLIKGSQ